MLGTVAAENVAPHAEDARWRAFRVAVVNLLVKRAGEKGERRFGDASDEAVLARLAALRVDGRSRPLVRSALFDAGADVGRHVYSKRVFEDTLAGAVIVLSLSLHQSGLGRVTLVDHFHRQATLRFEASSAAAGADVGLLDAYVAGAASGFLSEAFNCVAHVAIEGPGALAVRLGEGRDVNGRRGAA